MASGKLFKHGCPITDMHVMLKIAEVIYWVVMIIGGAIWIWAALLGLGIPPWRSDDQTVKRHSAESETQD
jgi:hypothetical protein